MPDLVRSSQRNSGDGAAQPDAALVIQGLSKSYGSRRALEGLSFNLPTGGALVLFGPNGAGKTTLLRLLATLERPTAGSAQVLGWDIAEQPEAVRRQIGLISHRSMLFLDLTAEENLLFYARLYGVDQPQARISELLALVELTARRHDNVRGFSRGMRQRLAIARSLLHDPPMLLLDEPFSGLDPRATALLDGLIDRVREQKSLVVVSHDLTRGYALASHLMVIDQGRMVLSIERDSLGLADFQARYANCTGGGETRR